MNAPGGRGPRRRSGGPRSPALPPRAPAPLLPLPLPRPAPEPRPRRALRALAWPLLLGFALLRMLAGRLGRAGAALGRRALNMAARRPARAATAPAQPPPPPPPPAPAPAQSPPVMQPAADAANLDAAGSTPAPPAGEADRVRAFHKRAFECISLALRIDEDDQGT